MKRSTYGAVDGLASTLWPPTYHGYEILDKGLHLSLEKGAKVDYVPLKNLGSGVAGALKRLFLTPVRLFKGLSKVANGDRMHHAAGAKKD